MTDRTPPNSPDTQIAARKRKRIGRLVLCFKGDPDTPSRWCRWFGHGWARTTTSRGAEITHIWRFCNRCGASESYYPPDSKEAEPGYGNA